VVCQMSAALLLFFSMVALAADAGSDLALAATFEPESVPVEEIDLDLAPSERWTALAQKYREDIIGRCQHMGRMYQVGLGKGIGDRWVRAAPLDDELRAEYQGIVNAVNHRDVTFHCLVLTDMWQAVDSPTFGCSGLLAAMANGTVIHGRNIDYDTEAVAKQAMSTGAGIGGNRFFDGVFKQQGRPIASFLAIAGSLGIHTGMRLGAYSINSNARLLNNKMMDNLQAHEAGGQNFPWVLRRMLQDVTDFESAVRMIQTTELNAPNYFIFAGSQPYQGAIVTKDRKGTHGPSTPPAQWLNASRGIWHLVQTNDDLLSPPEDARRGTALMRLSRSQQSMVDMDFVEREMKASPVMNSDTLVTWVAQPRAGTHRVFMKPMAAVAAGMVDKMMHRALHIPMPQDLSSRKSTKAEGSLRGRLEAE